MANENTPEPGQPESFPSPSPSGEPDVDPWATTPRHRLTPPPEGDSPFARPATNPYATASYGSEPTTQLPPYPGAMPPPPPPGPYGAAPYAASMPPASPPAAPAQNTWPNASRGSSLRDANPLSALFDFSFSKFATPGLVKIVYILAVVASIGSWLLWVLAGFSAGSFGGGTGAGVVALLFGWIPALLAIAFTRFVLEGIVALIRIHDRVTEIAARDKESS